MALSRSRRANAGSKMATLLNSMEADDFYTTTYGGFNEDEADADFECDAKPITEEVTADADDDIVDSDFSIDEDDEPRSDVENEDDPDRPKRAKRALGVQTKAYKEPKKDKEKPKVRKVSLPPAPPPGSTPLQINKPDKRKEIHTDIGRKFTRASTVNKTVETVKRQKERALHAKRMLKKKLAQRKHVTQKDLTQEELLEEAKETEILNRESLKKFQLMEIEAKKMAMKASKRSIQGAYIRFLSTSMPLPKESNPSSIKEDRINVDDLDEVKEPEVVNEAPEVDRHERTFITFSDHETFRKNFPHRRPRETTQKICPITRLPAKYFDPVTRLPYANLQAFRILREAYYNQLELKGDKNDPEVAAWLEWRLKNKPSKPPIITQIARPPAAFSHLLANATPVGTPNRPSGVTSVGQATPNAALTPISAGVRQPASALTSLPTATIIQTTQNSVAVQQPPPQQQQPAQQQQSVVLPARTMPLTQPPVPVAQLLQTSQAQLAQGSFAAATGQPLVSSPMQTVKIGGGQPTQMSLTGITRTSLTQAQLQQITSGVNRNNLAAFNVLRTNLTAGGQRTQLMTTRPAMATNVSPSAMLRPQGVTPGQVTLQQPQQNTRPHAIALQRPGGLTTQTAIALQPSGVRTGTGQFLVAQGGAAGTRQQIVVASSVGGQQTPIGRQIMMTTAGGGTPGRPGHILVTGQGSHQSQIVVSQSGQLILNQTVKQATQQQQQQQQQQNQQQIQTQSQQQQS